MSNNFGNNNDFGAGQGSNYGQQGGDAFELDFELRGELRAEGSTVKDVAGPSVGPFEEYKDAFLLRRAGEGLNLYARARGQGNRAEGERGEHRRE